MATKTEIIDLYKLTPTDYLTVDGGVMIVKRTGIKKIQKVLDISVSIALLSSDKEHCALLATAELNGQRISAVGSATPANCSHPFIHETAEYRAVSRAVLEAAGLKESDVFSEDEFNAKKIEDSVKSPINELVEKTKPLSLVGYVYCGKHKGLIGEVTSSDDVGLVIGDVMHSYDDVISWDPMTHLFMTDNRSITDNNSIVRLLAKKGVTAKTFLDDIAGSNMGDKYKDFSKFLIEAPLLDVLNVIGIKLNFNK
jgi:hypothetical protein